MLDKKKKQQRGCVPTRRPPPPPPPTMMMSRRLQLHPLERTTLETDRSDISYRHNRQHSPPLLASSPPPPSPSPSASSSSSPSWSSSSYCCHPHQHGADDDCCWRWWRSMSGDMKRRRWTSNVISSKQEKGRRQQSNSHLPDDQQQQHQLQQPQLVRTPEDSVRDSRSTLSTAAQRTKSTRTTSKCSSFPLFIPFSSIDYACQCDQLQQHHQHQHCGHLSSSLGSCPLSDLGHRTTPPTLRTSRLGEPWTMLALCFTFLLCLTTTTLPTALADSNRFYHMSSLCQRGVLPVYKKVDGAVLSSKAENNLECTITFQTDTILQKFMIRFEKLALDCNDHLYIFDGAHTIGNYKADLSCRSTRAEIGTIYTQSNFLTLRYTTDGYSKADNGFRMIITAYKDSKNFCREHRCANQFCISRGLVCDRVNHCGDNSDETYAANCQVEAEPEETIIGLEPFYFIIIVSAVFTLCLFCVISVSICLYRRERMLQQQRIALQQQYGMAPMAVDGLGAVGPLGPTLVIGPTGATPILGINNYGAKLDGTCTMITSLDGYGATRNGGLVNSFTHTALPNNFSTLPHVHHHNMAGQQPSPLAHVAAGSVMNNMGASSHAANAAAVAAAAAAAAGGGHVRFGTLPARGGGGSGDKPAPPPYINNGNGNIPAGNGTGNGTYPMAEVVVNSSGVPGAPIQTQVIYTTK